VKTVKKKQRMPKYRSRSTSGTTLRAALGRWVGHAGRRPAPLLAAAIILSPIAWSLCLGAAHGEDAAVAQGKALYASNKCAICHSIDAKGGSVGPALDDTGKKWTLDKMVAFLQAPSSVNPDSSMPAMHGTPAEIRAIAAYMMSLGGTPRVVAQEPNIAWGQQLFASEHCFYCHQIGNKGGKLGPALDQEAERHRTPEFLATHFKNPSVVTPGSVMPAIVLNETQVQSLIFYIQSLKPGVPVPAIVLPSPGQGGTEPSVVEGEALYSAVNCSSCHAIGGKGTFAGPALDYEGNSGRTLDWILAHFNKPDEAAPGTFMPVVQGTDRQLRSLALYLLSQTTPIIGNAQIGQKIYADRSCGYCHGSDAKGTKTGPALAGAKSAARTDAWILEHFRNPAAVTPNSVMPRVWAAPWEMQSLLDYLKGLRA
jgi:mono/diheme cytochrome c family protein